MDLANPEAYEQMRQAAICADDNETQADIISAERMADDIEEHRRLDSSQMLGHIPYLAYISARNPEQPRSIVHFKKLIAFLVEWQWIGSADLSQWAKTHGFNIDSETKKC